MSNVVLWGTSIPPAEYTVRRLITDEGDYLITDDEDFLVATVAPAQVIYYLVTDAGDFLVDDEGNNLIVLAGLQGPQYFQTADVTTDGGEPFQFKFQTNPWQPDAQGGECVFAWADITPSWSMSGTIRVSAYADNNGDPLEMPDGNILENVRSTFLIDQQGGNLERVSEIFPVPLVRRLTTSDGDEISRWYLRGQRLTVILESTGALGVGELLLEGIEVSYDPVRKAVYATVDSGD